MTDLRSIWKVSVRPAILSLALASFLITHFTAPAWAREPALDQILLRSREAVSNGVKPVIVMDLDETLIDSTMRRYQSYQSALSVVCGVEQERDCAKIAGLNLSDFQSLDNRYDQTQLFDQLGISASPWRTSLLNAMLSIYLSNQWMSLDEAIPGASAYVQELRNAGATLFFVSSRWKSTQEAGTLLSLKHLRMASDAETQFLLLRPDGMDSLEFKRQSFAHILEWSSSHGGKVLGAFENEPENLNAMHAQFPGVTLVFDLGAWIKQETLNGSPTLIRNYR